MKENICNLSRAVRDAAAAAVIVCACLAQGCGAPSGITVTSVNSAQSEQAAVLVSDVSGRMSGEDGSSGKSTVSIGTDAEGASGSDAGDKGVVAVYVCGAVVNPGVYYLKDGDRICDAVEAAGGFTEDADKEWLNQARLISDGEMLVVCTEDETSGLHSQGITQPDAANGNAVSAAASAQQAASPDGALINLNTATKEQLMTLPGIGEAKADSIIRYRTESGFFASTEDVMNISGIKNSIYEKIRDRITV